MPLAINKLRITKAGEIVLRYALWKKRGEVIVSVYGFIGMTKVREVLLQRVNMPLEDARTDAYYGEAGRNLAALWATTNCVGDFFVFRGNTIPCRTFHPTEQENQP